MDQSTRPEQDLFRIRVYLQTLGVAEMHKSPSSDTEDSSYRPEVFRVPTRSEEEMARLRDACG
jgi:hypothetical protein